MPIQVQSLSLLGALQAMTVALMLWLGVRSDKSRMVRSLYLRASALAVEALGYASLAFGQHLLPAIVTLGGNALNLLAQAMSVIALRMLLGAPLRWRSVVAVGVVGWVGVAWFAVAEPDYQSRVLWGSVAIACNLLLNIEALLGDRRDHGSRARYVLLWIFVLSLLLLVWRNGMLWLTGRQLLDVYAPNPINVFWIFMSIMQPLFYGLGFVLLYNELLQHELYVMARTDPLTGVPNRLALEERFAGMLIASEVARVPFCLLLLDVDHFKSVNDRFGHDCGDEALKALMQRVGAALHPGSMIGRLGGEEFIVLVPAAGRRDGESLAEWIREAVMEMPVVVDGRSLPLTISVGVAEVESYERDMSSTLRRADKALYVAKHGGRNCVVAAPASPAGRLQVI
jgi:diguanylate cyclase (GGDEF)-like protein